MNHAPDRPAEVAALFDGSRLTMARHLAGLRKSDLAARVNKSPTAVAAWGVWRKATNSGYCRSALSEPRG